MSRANQSLVAKSSTAHEGLWAKITTRYRFQAYIQISKEGILLIAGGVCMTTQGPPIPQKTWPCVITWQNQHTHLAVSAAAAVQLSVVM